MLVYTSVELNKLDTPAKEFINPAQQNQFVQEINFSDTSARPIAIAMITKSAFIRSYDEKPFWCKQFVGNFEYSEEVTET